MDSKNLFWKKPIGEAKIKKMPTSIRNFCGKCSEIKAFMFLNLEVITGLGTYFERREQI
jgi:hypothetical protein